MTENRREQWKIWYDDESTVSSHESSAVDAPVDGVLAILEKRPDNPENPIMTHHGNEYYYWTGENWMHGSLVSMHGWLRRDFPTLFYGRWADDSIFDRIFQQVVAESVAWQ